MAFVIEEKVLSDTLLAFADNIISGKGKSKPGIEHLPAGVRYMNSLEMVKDENGLYWPESEEVRAGVQNKKIEPLYPTDIVPEWVKVKIKTNDPDFTGSPWK